MLTTEYVRNCNCNYLRIHLENKPEEKRYQYCILNRGGIRHLLPGSLRYINGEAYLYYDISSTQNVGQLFETKTIRRSWMKDFLWGMKQMLGELDRFLLEEQCVLWNPELIFQDLEKNDFFFLYVPYYKEEVGLISFMNFLVERIDYEDEGLVDFVYAVYEQVRVNGQEYLRKHIHEAWEELERREAEEKSIAETTVEEKTPIYMEEQEETSKVLSVPEKKGIGLWAAGRRRKQKQREDYRERMRDKLLGMKPLAVCEETVYEENIKVSPESQKVEEEYGEEYGKTIYIEESPIRREPGLYKTDGELITMITEFPFVIGKKKEDVSLAINDYSVSRIHARITEEDGNYYIEDLNSTNGTYKNGLRLQPYEKRKLEKEDELKFGKTEYLYR